MGKLIIKLTGCRLDGRSVDGEYDGGDTIEEARERGKEFASNVPSGRIAIVQPINDGIFVTLVEEVRAK